MPRVIGPAGGQVVKVHQDAYVYVARLPAGTSVSHRIGAARGAYVYLIGGTASFDRQDVSVMRPNSPTRQSSSSVPGR